MKASVEFITKKAAELKDFLTSHGVSEKWFIMVMQIDQIKEDELEDRDYLVNRIENHLDVQGVDMEEKVHEDNLPAITDVEYTEWFKTSRIEDGVRVGFSYICIADKLIDLLNYGKDNKK